MGSGHFFVADTANDRVEEGCRRAIWHAGLMRARARPAPILSLAVFLAGMALAGVAGATSQLRLAQAAPRVTLAPRSGPVGTSLAVRGSGFRPRVKGLVLFGRRRVASFVTTSRGRFLVRFAVPTGAGGQVQLIAQQLARGRRGSRHPLKRAGARFRVVPLKSRGAPAGGSTGGGVAAGRWVPPQSLTWYWQLQGTVNNSEPVAAYDIDGFDNSAAEVSSLHGQGKHVICYIDVGTAENWRPDYSSFPASVLGSSNGWPGERWLDISKLSILEPIMTARFQMCREKGFDAVEPDNMDGYENSTGFPLTASEQLSYDEWIAGEVHALGMAVLQKNDGEQVAQLESDFDGALDEQCNQYHECASFEPYLAAGKPVLNAEYSLSTSSFCAADNAAGIMGARYGVELNGSSFEPCW